MVVLRIQGGLGNQMFQYATALQLSKKLGVELFLDTSLLSDAHEGKHTQRRLELDVFAVEIKFASGKLIGSFNQTLFRKIFPLFQNSIIISERNWSSMNLIEGRKNVLLQGYFQSEKYFKNGATDISEVFKFKNIDEKNIKLHHKIKLQNCVGLHIRRGDYVTNSAANAFHGVLSLDYYQKAVKYLIERESPEIAYIFSDDPDWCRKNVNIGLPTEIIDHNQGADSYIDMMLMSACKNLIIANSSFSWWSAYLGKKEKKTIIAPVKWFAASGHSDEELIPSHWIRL